MEEKNFEEISLKEIIEIINKHRLLIIAIVVASLLLSAVYAFLIAVPMYSAQAEIEIINIDTGVSSINNAINPKLVTDTLLAQIKDPQFLEQVSKSLGSNNLQIDIAAMTKIISATKGKDGKSISILARYKEKKDVPQIANVAANVLSDYSTIYLKDQIQQQKAITYEHIKLAKSYSEEALSKYKEYVSSPESLSKLQSELDIDKSIIVQLKANLISGNIGLGKSKEQLEQDIIKLEEEIPVLNEKLVDANSLDRILQEELDSSLEIYRSFNKEYNRMKLAESYYKDKTNINILAQAVEPESVSWPNRKLTVLVSLILGIGIAVFMAFAIEYFKNGK